MCNTLWGNIVNLYNDSMSWAVVMFSKRSFLSFDVIRKDARVCIGMKKYNALWYKWQVLALHEEMYHF